MADDTPSRDDDIQAFFRLVGTGRFDEVLAAIAGVPALVKVVGPHPFWGGRPQALHVAIEAKRRDMIRVLLASGADVNGTNDEYDGWSPLMLAMNRGLDDVRDDLVRRGAHAGLVEALMMADDARVEALLGDSPQRVAGVASNRGSLLSFARTPAALDRLLALGVPADVPDRWGAIPIEALSRLGPRGRDLVRHLVERGIEAPPDVWARLGDRDALSALIDRTPAVASSDAVMMAAVDFRHHDLVTWLLSKGAPVQARAAAPSRQTALHSAAWNGDLPMVSLLVEAGADRSVRDDEHHGTPKEWAEVAVEVTNNPRCAEVAAYLGQQ